MDQDPRHRKLRAWAPGAVVVVAWVAAACGSRTPLNLGNYAGSSGDDAGGTDGGTIDAPVVQVTDSGTVIHEPDSGPMVDCLKAGMVPPSCCPGGDGQSNCGPGGAGSESCCTTIPVPGGSYNRSYSNFGMGPIFESDPATVSGFKLDKYFVTVARFRQFVAAYAAGWRPAAGSGTHSHLNGGQGLSSTTPGFTDGWDPTFGAALPAKFDDWSTNLSCDGYATWTATPGDNESRPVNCVLWTEAYAFCIWDHGFLPSHAEYEYVAAGGSEEREYPWGSTDPGVDNRRAIWQCLFPSLVSGDCKDFHNVAPVGTPDLGAGKWGHLDLVGNLHQWTMDWEASYFGTCNDCANLGPPTYERVSRGGDYADPTSEIAFLNPQSGPDEEPLRSNAYGLRCARTP